MIFKWDEKLNTGIVEIDEQHKKLFGTIHSLRGENLDYDSIIKILVDLRNYVLEHFSTEEIYMKKFEYPYYEEHKILHENFTNDYNDLLVELAGGLLVQKIPPSLSDMLNTWLMTHYQDADMKMAAFLRERLGIISEE
ncbi:MAG: bacteriohemerythrin [bacterium]